MMNVLLVRVENRIEDVFEVEDMTIGELIVEILRDLSPQYSKYKEVEFLYIEEIDEYALLEYLECIKKEMQTTYSLHVCFPMMFVPCTKEIVLHRAKRIISLLRISDRIYEIRVSKDLRALKSECSIEEVMCTVEHGIKKHKLVFLTMEYKERVGQWKKLSEVDMNEFAETIRTSEDLAGFLKSQLS